MRSVWVMRLDGGQGHCSPADSSSPASLAALGGGGGTAASLPPAVPLAPSRHWR